MKDEGGTAESVPPTAAGGNDEGDNLFDRNGDPCYNVPHNSGSLLLMCWRSNFTAKRAKSAENLKISEKNSAVSAVSAVEMTHARATTRNGKTATIHIR